MWYYLTIQFRIITKIKFVLVAFFVFKLCEGQVVSVNEEFFVAASTTVFIDGGLQIQADGTIYNKGVIQISGDVQNLGNYQVGPTSTITASQGELLLSGASNQNIVFGSDSVFNLTLNNTAGFTGGNLFVSGNLFFENGILDIGNSFIGFTGSGTAANFSENSFIRTSGIGTVRKKFTSPSLFTFPIGTVTAFTPMIFNPLTSLSEFSVRVQPTLLVNPKDNNSAPMPNSVSATWVITSTVSLSNSIMQVNYPATIETGTFNRNNASLLSWEDVPATTAWMREPATTTGNVLRNTSGVTNFSANSNTTYFLGVAEDLQTSLHLTAKVFLEGAYLNGGTMRGSLRNGVGGLNMLATYAVNQPFDTLFSVPSFRHTGGERVNTNFFHAHMNIVDWVLVELRDKNNYSNILTSRAGLLRTDGQIIDTNGVLGLRFSGVPFDDYYVAIRHRNHLGVMGNNTLFINADPVSSFIDFSTATTPLYGLNAAVEIEPGVRALHLGNSNPDNVLRFTGSNNDKATIGLKTNSSQNVLNVIPGYKWEDIDLSSEVRFSGTGNDKALLGIKLNTSTNLLNTITEQLP